MTHGLPRAETIRMGQFLPALFARVAEVYSRLKPQSTPSLIIAAAIRTALTR